MLSFCLYSYQFDSNAKERHSEKPVLSHMLEALAVKDYLTENILTTNQLYP